MLGMVLTQGALGLPALLGGRSLPIGQSGGPRTIAGAVAEAPRLAGIVRDGTGDVSQASPFADTVG